MDFVGHFNDLDCRLENGKQVCAPSLLRESTLTLAKHVLLFSFCKLIFVTKQFVFT